MSLQIRLTDFITAVGADIKAHTLKLANPAYTGFGNQQAYATYGDFNALPDFGWYFVAGGTNGPGIVGGTNEYYVQNVSLGSTYTYSQYALQIAYKRNLPGLLATRYREAGTWGAWTIIGQAGQILDGGVP